MFVITQLSIGIYMDNLPEEAEEFWVGLHIAIGGTAAVFIAFRVLWRLFVKRPAAMPQHRYLQILSRAVHDLFLLAITVMIIPGPLMVWTAGYPVNIFDVVVIPTPFGKMEAVNEILESIHGFTATCILVLLGLHILGTLKHLIINRDRSLKRILGGSFT